MKELSTIFPITTESVNDFCVDLRKLHKWLGVVTPFDKWVKRKVENSSFKQDVDFSTFLSKTSGRPMSCYFATVTMAKKLGMMEKTDKGDKIRDYFLEVEKRFKEGQTMPSIPTDTIGIMELALTALKELKAEQQRHDAELKDLRKQVHTLTAEPDDLITVRAFMRLDGIKLSGERHKEVGMLAAKLSRECGFRMDSVPDAKWGKLNTYEQHIIADALYALYPDVIDEYYSGTQLQLWK